MDRHHVEVVRTHASTLDGVAIGKYLKRETFIAALPAGHAVADMVLALDMGGVPYPALWHHSRNAVLGDILLRPDLSTLLTDGTDKNLGHVICDFTTAAGEPVELCARTQLRQATARLEDAGYEARVGFELEFFVFEESFREARAKGHHNLTPLAARPGHAVYQLRAAQAGRSFMDIVLKRLNWRGIRWEGWSSEASAGQFELNFAPMAPLVAADAVVSTRQVLYEVALEIGCSVTFMPQPVAGESSGMHIHHCLLNRGDNTPAFASADGSRTEAMDHWIGGLMATLPGATSFFCPSINAYRRLQPFAAVPVTPTWGEENKSAALRIISRSPAQARIEHRVGAADLNPYLALAAIFAGGLAGLENRTSPPPEFKGLAWGLPPEADRLPASLSLAFAATHDDLLLRSALGDSFINYWVGTREHEWLRFHQVGGDSGSTPTEWELGRYFDLV